MCVCEGQLTWPLGFWGGASWCRAAPNQCRLPREAPLPSPWQVSADCCCLATSHTATVTYHLTLASPEMHQLHSLSVTPNARWREPVRTCLETLSRSPSHLVMSRTLRAWIGDRDGRVMPATAAFWVRAGGGGRVAALHDGRDDNQY